MNLDLYLLQKLNGLVALKGPWYFISNALGENPLIRGVPIFMCLLYVWFSKKDIQHKSKIILGIFGVCLAVLISIYSQSNLSVHIRPLLDNSINIANPNEWSTKYFDKRIYSFPSDTATAYCALSFIVFLRNTRLGVICLLWSILVAGATRIALGMHYPSDILGGLILGSAVVLICSTNNFSQNFVENLLEKYDPQFIKINILLFLFCAEAYTLFQGLLPIYHFISKIHLSLI